MNNFIKKLRKNGCIDYIILLLLNFLTTNTLNNKDITILAIKFFYIFVINYMEVDYSSIGESKIAVLIICLSQYLNLNHSFVSNDYVECFLIFLLHCLLNNSFKDFYSKGVFLIISEYLLRIIRLSSVMNIELNTIHDTTIIIRFLIKFFVFYYKFKYCYLLLIKRLYIYLIILLAFISFNLIHITEYELLAFINTLHNLILKVLFTSYINIILYWISIIILGVFIIEQFKGKSIIKRKLFHFLSLLIFIPGFIYVEKDYMLSICVIVACSFLIIEVIRCYLPNRLNFISKYLIKNIDNRDSSSFILSHTFLLIGCFITYLLNSLENKNSIIMTYAGLLLMGLGDSFASIIGTSLGKIKIFPPTSRTLEGTIAGWAFSIIGFMLLIFLYDIALFRDYIFLTRLIITLLLVMIYEGYTLQIDNLVLPLFTFEIMKFIVN